MKRNEGVSMITLIITIIVIIILAAIAFVGMDDATGSAQYARFSSEFGDYATNFTGGAVTKVQESLGLAGKVANKAQIIYCAARGVNLSEFDKVLNSVTLPGGYTSEKFQTAIKDATGATYVLADANTPCYEIKDDVMKEYEGKSFYGNSNGQETHWVTASGKVFTLPGYPRTVDGEDRMYISADLYYVPENGDMILASELKPFKARKIDNKDSGATIGSQEYTDAADHANPSGNTGGEEGGELLASKVKMGDYVNYPVTYSNVMGDTRELATHTGWRVLKVKDDGTVNLVSAGTPLTFYCKRDDTNAEVALTTDFLETEFTDGYNSGYRQSGFAAGTKLKDIFKNEYTKMSGDAPVVRALTLDGLGEVASVEPHAGYDENDNIVGWWYRSYNVENAINDDESLREMFFEENYAYWLATSAHHSLYFADSYGITYFNEDGEDAIRVVVSLKPKVKTTGQDASGAWNIEI